MERTNFTSAGLISLKAKRADGEARAGTREMLRQQVEDGLLTEAEAREQGL
jgi:hypothetical protein